MTAERQIPMVLVAVSLAVVLLVPAVSVAAQAGPAVLSDVTVTSQPDAINIFVWTSRETKYRAELIEAPRRLIIDLEDTVYAWRKTPFTVRPAPSRAGPHRPGDARPGTASRTAAVERLAAHLVRLQGRRRRQPPPHPGGREHQEHRDQRRRQGQDVDLAAQRAVGACLSDDPRRARPREDREGQRRPHRLPRGEAQGGY